MTDFELRIRITQSLAEVPAHAWNMCAGDAVEVAAQPNSELKSTSGDNLSPALSTRGNAPNPFLSHEFLCSLEASRSVGGRTGWQPRHLLAENAAGELLGAAPCYVKTHSRGEYVFDQGWAEAFERAGGNYYPKLQVAVPFTPVTGPRLLVRPSPSADAARQALVAASLELVKRERASSLHVTFPLESEWKRLTDLGLLARTDRQFHWINEGYKTFEDFLAALSSRKRKMIHRERREACANGVEILRLTGSDLTEDSWDAFYAFYIDTGSRKWGAPYLNRAFFSIIGERMRDRIVLIMAKRAGRF